MKTKPNLYLSLPAVLIVMDPIVSISCNPIGYDPGLGPYYGINSMPMMSPFIMAPQFDPYGMQAQSPFMYNTQLMPMQASESLKRSVNHPAKLPGAKGDPGDPEDQKSADGLPVSFLEPDPPSSITERLSDSFSAIGEGVRNHFRSMTENFSDTMEDLKDAWKFSDASRKRG